MRFGIITGVCGGGGGGGKGILENIPAVVVIVLPSVPVAPVAVSNNTDSDKSAGISYDTLKLEVYLANPFT